MPQGGEAMPRKPKRPCSYPGCPNLTEGQYCKEHEAAARRQYNKYERSADVNKKYGRAWKRIRDRYAAAHPLCEMCLKEGRLTPVDGKCQAATQKPFGVNVPLMYPEIETIMQIIMEEGVKIVFTSAGNPKTWTDRLHQQGILVAHVVSSTRFAAKCEEAGVDAVVAEGFEAGGHNGREETTTFCLIPAVRKLCALPLIAAGGIVSGEGILAAQSLGADGVQLGTRFALTAESSAHFNFKDRCLQLNEGDTVLTLKQLSPTRLVKNEFYRQVAEAESRGASEDEIRELLGKGRAKKGIFEGNLEEGELEIGQAASMVKHLQTVKEVMSELVSDYNRALRRMQDHLSWGE